jgi:hypothetical protein
MKEVIKTILIMDGWKYDSEEGLEDIVKLITDFAQWLYSRGHEFHFNGPKGWFHTTPDSITYCDLNYVFDYWYDNIRKDE